MLNIYHSPGMWPCRFQLWWVAATFLPQEANSLPPTPPHCPDSAFECGRWFWYQLKSLSWNTLTCFRIHRGMLSGALGSLTWSRFNWFKNINHKVYFKRVCGWRTCLHFVIFWIYVHILRLLVHCCEFCSLLFFWATDFSVLIRFLQKIDFSVKWLEITY